MKNKNRFTEVCILDVCYSDYFQGYSYPVLSIPVYYGQTNKDLGREILSEINSVYDYLCDSENSLTYTEKEIKIFERYAKKLIRSKKQLLGYVSEDINNGIDGEDLEFSSFGCYIYLGLCKPVFKYGMQFLNN